MTDPGLTINNGDTLVDGRPQCWVPANDRGLAYADGVFRTLMVTAGAPIAWQNHCERLAHDCQRLALVTPSPTTLHADLEHLFALRQNGVAKIIITRNGTGRGYAPPPDSVSRRIVSAHPAPATAAEPTPLTLDVSPIAWPIQPRLAGVKHLGRLEQVMARADCDRRGQRDALMCDTAGRVISTTMRNLVLLDSAGRWVTPALERTGIAGATRQRLLIGRAARGRPVRRVDLSAKNCDGVMAAIAINSVGGIVPVERILGRRLTINADFVAEARQLMADSR